MTQTAEEKAKETIFSLDQIIACIPGNVYWMDKNFIQLGCSNDVLKMLGITREQYVGKNYEELTEISGWPLGGMDSFKKDDTEVLKSGKPSSSIEEPLLKHKDGRHVQYLTTRVPIRNEAEEIVGVIGVSVDITERKEIEEKLKEANRAKSEFLGNAVKEIDSPIKQIQSIAKALSKTEKEKLEEALLQINQILNDMESFSKFDLTNRNQFSGEDINEKSKRDLKASVESLKAFEEYYKNFKLFPRESQCMYYLIRGMSAKQIGKKLGLSPRTVEFYLNNAKTKMACKTKQELIEKVIAGGIL